MADFYDSGPFVAVIEGKNGYSGTPVPATSISYRIVVNVPGGVQRFDNVRPTNWRPPPPYITEGAPVGSACLVQFVAGTLQAFIPEWPAAKVCTP